MHIDLMTALQAADRGERGPKGDYETWLLGPDDDEIVCLGSAKSLHGALRALGMALLDWEEQGISLDPPGDPEPDTRGAPTSLREPVFRAVAAFFHGALGHVRELRENQLEDSAYFEPLFERHDDPRVVFAVQAAPPSHGYACAIIDRRVAGPRTRKPPSLARCMELIDERFAQDLRPVLDQLSAALSAGADPNVVDADGNTPLHTFLESGYAAHESTPEQLVEVVRILVAAGAADRKSGEGVRASEMAAAWAEEDPDEMGHYGVMATILRGE